MTGPERIEDVEWGDPPEPRVETAEPRKCRHPRPKRVPSSWLRVMKWYEPDHPEWLLMDKTNAIDWCNPDYGGCGHVFRREVVKRNRNNRKRGNSIERLVCNDLGVTPRGRFGDPVDGGSDVDPYLVQVKTGGFYSPVQQRIIDAMDGQRRGRPAILVTVETPGPGHRARRLVTMTYEDFRWLVDPSRTTGNATPAASEAESKPPKPPG